VSAVNWEREPGEKVEEFVAALLLLEHPAGNLITPSRGDRGVDIRVPNPDGFDIYQVKRYTRPLTSRQAKEIETSWARFVRENAAGPARALVDLGDAVGSDQRAAGLAGGADRRQRRRDDVDGADQP
jgi:hypothetical protein